jgi:hypothetical protein
MSGPGQRLQIRLRGGHKTLNGMNQDLLPRRDVMVSGDTQAMRVGVTIVFARSPASGEKQEIWLARTELASG